MLMLLAALAPVASAAAADRVLVANVPRAVAEALRTGAAPATERLRVGFVLAHPHPDAEDALLRGLFDRSSPNYHRFVTPAQYAQRFGVSAGTQHDVRAWLAGGGLRVEHVTGAGRLRPGLGHRRAGAGAAEDDDRPLPGGRQDLRRQRHGARRARALPIYAVLGLDSSRRHRTMADLSGRQGTPNVGVQSPEELRSVYEHPAGHHRPGHLGGHPR